MSVCTTMACARGRAHTRHEREREREMGNEGITGPTCKKPEMLNNFTFNPDSHTDPDQIICWCIHNLFV